MGMQRNGTEYDLLFFRKWASPLNEIRPDYQFLRFMERILVFSPEIFRSFSRFLL